MERAAHRPEPEGEIHAQPEPVARDPELPTIADGALIGFAAAALVATAIALLLLIG
jgi:hypothetical protein